MSQQIISTVKQYKGTVNDVMNKELKKCMDHLPKKQQKAREMMLKFNQAFDKLKEAIKYSKLDKFYLEQILSNMQLIHKQFNDKHDSYIYHLQLVRQPYYIKLKELIYNKNHKYQDKNSYVYEFLKIYDQFDTKMYDTTDSYIQNQLYIMSNNIFNKFKNQMKANDDEFEATLKKVLLQAFRYKLVSYLQDGKPKDITDLLEDYDQLLPLIDEYNQQHTQDKALLNAELKYFQGILEANGMQKVDTTSIENMDVKEVVEQITK